MELFLRQLHRWLGFPIGLLFLLTFATGFLTATEELLFRTQSPTSQFTYRETTIEEDAHALTTMTKQHKEIRQIIMPTQATPYYQAQLGRETFTYALNNLTQVSYEQRNMNGFFATVLQLHRNFLLGKEGLFGIGGAHYAAWAALIAMLISVLGLWLWWPMRNTFRVQQLLPKNRKRHTFYYSHTTGGVVILLFILLMSLTGASITYRTVTQKLLGVSAEKNNKDNDKNGMLAQLQKLEKNWYAWLTAAHEAMPEGTLTSIQLPRNTFPTNNIKEELFTPESAKQKSQSLMTFVFSNPGDWLGLPVSKIQIDSATLILVNHSRFKDLPLGEKIISVLKPLHTGKGLHAGYVVMLLCMSGLGIVMIFSGISSFVLKKRKRINLRFLSFNRISQ